MLIDVSKHQGIISWAKVQPRIEGAIIRLGYRGYSKTGNIVKDSMADSNINGCKKYGIPYGIYFFPCSINDQEAVEEADWIIQNIKGLNLSYPIWLDSEVAEAVRASGRADKLDKKSRTKFLNIIINRVQAKTGIKVGVYASEAWFKSNLVLSELDCPLWVAKYGKNTGTPGTRPNIGRDYDIWQYSSVVKMDGIRTKVDANLIINDVKPANPKPAPTPAAAPLLELVENTMLNKYGTGNARKAALGNNYKPVMDTINHIAKAPLATLVAETKAGTYGNGEQRKHILDKRYAEVMAVINGKSTYYARVKPLLGLNVRKTPEITKTNKICALIFNTRVQVLSTEGSWSRVKLQNGTVGYVASEHLKKE